MVQFVFVSRTLGHKSESHLAPARNHLEKNCETSESDESESGDGVEDYETLEETSNKLYKKSLKFTKM